ncbi:MAG: TrmO family methyltransferase [Desulfomicrobium sp.]|nr:TrmO family methyltransferase [Desulfomicrobium sp.]NLV96649.1 tRNA (N6-threonylcarbamoyladenosine(37)-N6)-methyltransferase TrmO [Desulfovibrionales bacterium]
MQPRIIGMVRSHLLTREQCPKSGVQSLPPVWIDVHEDYAQAAHDLQIGDAIVVLTWLHQSSQDIQRCHPRGNKDLPLRGVFSTRSPDRPTPIGLHSVRIVGRKGLSLEVHPLEAVHGTPVIDIKPDITAGAGRVLQFPALVAPETGASIVAAGRDGWAQGLFAGFNGNISMRQGSRVIITATGSAKGHLDPQDLAVVDLQTGAQQNRPQASSELAVHLEIYRHQPKAMAIVHTHPPHLLALSLRKSGDLLELPLFESQIFVEKMIRLPAQEPGSKALGLAVGQASIEYQAIFMDNHGLVCWGETMVQALGLSEELESLARIALMV